MQQSIAPTPHRPSQQIQRDLNELRSTPVPQVPDLTFLTAKMNRLSAEAQVDPQKRGELSDCLIALRQAEHDMASIGQRNSQIKNLEVELDLSQQAERLAKVQAADSALLTAINEYKAACLIAAKALRTVLDQQRRSSTVPGASASLSSLRLDKFNVPHLIPMSWQGTLGQSMQSGLMPWENQSELKRVA